jgi:hypothetical protein
MNMEQWWNDIFAGETEVLGENLPSAALSTTNPTWIDPGANPALRGERPATNRLSLFFSNESKIKIAKRSNACKVKIREINITSCHTNHTDSLMP